ncbi:hypothetical protein [Pedobacter cryotolerans]|uniref:DUF4595 domain-containing protein n=1 Tax=Pedobacter cryotolerans TaxID=2571270 RepID=A0A4U1CGB7_9SPHI|nr:hypothetical protein [Pedobacter cryotolerans]TKC03421.1 hypothetical protein FA045_02290 [Pedobacter cryotolerans]
MKKHFKLLTVFALMLITVGACKKDKTEEPVVETNCLVTTIIPTYNSKSGNLQATYNSNNKLIKLAGSSSDGDPVLYDITYNANNIYGVETNGSNKHLIVYNQDAQGRVIDIVDAGTVVAVLKYNSDGYISEISYGGNPLSDVAKLTYANGNLIKADILDYNKNLSEDIKFEYSTEDVITSVNLADPLFLNSGLGLVDAFIPNGVFGKVSKNQVKKITKSTYQGIIKYYTTDTFIYNKDSNGKIIDVAQNNLIQSQDGVKPLITLDNTNFSWGIKYNCK